MDKKRQPAEFSQIEQDMRNGTMGKRRIEKSKDGKPRVIKLFRANSLKKNGYSYNCCCRLEYT